MGAGVGRALRWSRDHDGDAGADADANDIPATQLGRERSELAVLVFYCHAVISMFQLQPFLISNIYPLAIQPAVYTLY